MNTFGTVVTAMVTPFTTDDKVDEETAARLASNLTREGWNDGLVINGTTGESTSTTDAEKLLLLETVVEAVGGRAKVIAGVGTSDTRHSIKLAEEASRAGADGLLVVTPYYSRPSQDGVLDHFRAIADSTGLPVMLYDIPKRSGLALDFETLEGASAHPNIVGLKDARGDLEFASWVVRETELEIYSGDDALNLPFLSIGASGFVSVAGHVAGDLLRRMLDLYRAGDTAGAAQLHSRLLPIYRGLFEAPGAASVKAALGMRGFAKSSVRLPYLELTSAEAGGLKSSLQLAGIL